MSYEHKGLKELISKQKQALIKMYKLNSFFFAY